MRLNRESFIKKYGQAARDATAGTRLFPEVLLAQAIVESSGKVGGVWYPGESQLSRLANNYFGIKADKAWKGKRYLIETREFKNGAWVTEYAAFRQYDSVLDSFRDWVAFLQNNPRYAKAGVFAASTPELQVAALHRAGYATDPNYTSVVSSVIRTVRQFMPAAVVAFSVVTGVLMVAAVIIFSND